MGDLAYSAFSRISQLAAQSRVHAAFRWFHLHERKVMQWQRDLVAIAAPPFGEEPRARWLADRFRELNLEQVRIDAEGNVLGWLGGDPMGLTPCVVLSAHIDTVFPKDPPIEPVLDEHRLKAPGACDNGAGVAALLALAAAIGSSGVAVPGRLLFVGNVGEEGEGDLRGIRHLYQTLPWGRHIAANVVVDGAGSGVVVTHGLGSRRYEGTIFGPGGHSWTDAGAPNPVVALSRAILALTEIPLPTTPRTTLNVGSIEGGTSVNSIPEKATARFDFRSLEAEHLVRLEVGLHRAMEDAVLAANKLAQNQHNGGRPRGRLRFEIKQIGNRPAGRLAKDAPILELLRAVDRHLGLHTEERVASTDANVPLSLGVPALGIGAGGEGGGIHTRSEWYDSTGRELALKRILLLLLALF
ncbi:MAG TPA: M20/M25/M40 family metallo-hydrolase [Acidobacteriaceae bacterium]|nr:M20/M25/M40 family metallo-hydrolase [Acidobacteriaceae bacterium]